LNPTTNAKNKDRPAKRPGGQAGQILKPIYSSEGMSNEWESVDHVFAYLARADKLPGRTDAEKILLDQIPLGAQRILDLGTGDGRLLALLRQSKSEAEGVALDFSETMLGLARKRFAEDKLVKIMKHDLNLPLPVASLGQFDAVVSGLAIHHLPHERKKECSERYSTC
jgi:tRNA (cmo5U34)-methyltransferase